jgi:predicted DNA-binding transcriptional regulator AlpA
MTATRSAGPWAALGGLRNMRLHPADIDAIARRVVALIQEREPQESVRLVDAAELASRLGVDRAWVYSHAKDLHAVRLGGPRGRMRFDIDAVLRLLDAEPARSPRRAARPRTVLIDLGGELLPIDP